MHISVVICDDLPEEQVTLARMIQTYCRGHQIELALELVASGDELLERWTPGRWDLIFLDIFMPGKSGVETARSLREKDKTCALIFATTSQEHGLESFELQVMDYLVKPFHQELLNQAMDWFVQQENVGLRQIRMDIEGSTYTIRMRDVEYVEICRHTALIRSGGQTYELRRTMEAMEEELNDDRFFRCHRSYLVNLDKVRRIERYDFTMEDGERVPISAKSYPEARRRFQEWMLAKHWGV